MKVYVPMQALHEIDSDEEEEQLRQKLISDLHTIENATFEVHDADLGPGASSPAYLIEFVGMVGATVVAAIFLAAKLERDLDDALSFSRRLYRLIQRLRLLGYDPVMTFEGVCSVALKEISDRDWIEDGINVSVVVVTNGYVQEHFVYNSLDELKSLVEFEQPKGFDPLSGTVKYTFFGSSGGALFMVTVDNNGDVLVSQRIY